MPIDRKTSFRSIDWSALRCLNWVVRDANAPRGHCNLCGTRSPSVQKPQAFQQFENRDREDFLAPHLSDLQPIRRPSPAAKPLRWSRYRLGIPMPLRPGFCIDRGRAGNLQIPGIPSLTPGRGPTDPPNGHPPKRFFTPKHAKKLWVFGPFRPDASSRLLKFSLN